MLVVREHLLIIGAVRLLRAAVILIALIALGAVAVAHLLMELPVLLAVILPLLREVVRGEVILPAAVLPGHPGEAVLPVVVVEDKDRY